MKSYRETKAYLKQEKDVLKILQKNAKVPGSVGEYARQACYAVEQRITAIIAILEESQRAGKWRKIGSFNTYQYWIGEERGKPVYNICGIDQPAPTGGYYRPESICSLKGLPNLFRQAQNE